MIDNRHTHQWSSDLILWQCDNFWITRKPQIMTLRLLIWKGSVMISPSSQGQLREDQINGQRVCLPSLVFTVGLFVASRGRFFSRGRSGEVEQSRRGLQSSSAPRRDHQHSPLDAREARTLDIVINIIIINIINKTTSPNWTPVTSFEEDWRRGERIYEVLPYCLFLNNLPYFFPRSKSISKVS